MAHDTEVGAGIPQGPILGPLLFLINIKDILDVIQANINLFAYDTSLHVSITVGDPADIGSILQSDIDKVTRWAQRPSKSIYVKY